MTTDSGIPIEFWQGVEQFNQGEFYACHDTLEAIWMEAMEPERTFYQGILQIAVGLYHLGNHNWRGCVTLMGEGIRRLGPYQPDYSDVAVTPLVDTAQDLLTALQQSGPESVNAIATHIHAHYPASRQSGIASSEDGVDSGVPETSESDASGETVNELPQLELRSPIITRII